MSHTVGLDGSCPAERSSQPEGPAVVPGAYGHDLADRVRAAVHLAHELVAESFTEAHILDVGSLVQQLCPFEIRTGLEGISRGPRR